MKTLSDILNESRIKVREYEAFEIKDKNHLKKSFIEAFKLVDKTFKEYKHLPEYDQIIEWIGNTEGKGLFMTGSFGRGKSTILTGVIPLLFRAYYNKALQPIPARDLHKSEIGWAVVIDDIGQEEIINDYGTKVDSVEYAISHCEDNMKLLIMTANLDSKQLESRYGGRILDRVTRLCKIVEFKGNSLRK